MKPFDLKLAKLGHPLCTREGVKIEAFHCFDVNVAYPITAILFNNKESYSVNGTHIESKSYDLFLDDSIPWEKPFQFGDEVYVKGNGMETWNKGIYLFTYKGGYYTVNDIDELNDRCTCANLYKWDNISTHKETNLERLTRGDKATYLGYKVVECNDYSENHDHNDSVCINLVYITSSNKLTSEWFTKLDIITSDNFNFINE